MWSIRIGKLEMTDNPAKKYSIVFNTTKKQTKTNKRSKEIVYNIFHQSSEYAEDTFWSEKLKTWSYGKLPSKFSFSDNVLTFRKRTKVFSSEVPINPREAVKVIISFFKTHGNICSPNEHFVLPVGEEITWTKCNKKTKEVLLFYYVTDMKETMSLSNAETKQLQFVILDAFSNKKITKDDITLESNSITEIKGIFWDEENRKFFTEGNNKVKRKVTKKAPAKEKASKTNTPKFMTYWIAYSKGQQGRYKKIRPGTSDDLSSANETSAVETDEVGTETTEMSYT